MTQVSYVAYIDESGDDGIMRVVPVDNRGASEWFVISALVVRLQAQREHVWVRNILDDLGLTQRKHLHFKDLDEWQRKRACEHLANLPVRCFVVLSNKRNMRAYSNPRAEKFNRAGRTWFYWWMTRLLLERVTDYCERRSLRDYKEPRTVRFEFPRRKGLGYAHLQGYLYYLRMQSKAGALYINKGDIKWSVVDPLGQVAAYDHTDRAGLQLSDLIASSFFQGVNGKPDFATTLEPRMAANAEGRIWEYGVKLMPDRYIWRATPSQRPVLDFYSKMRRQAPGP